MKTNWKHSLLDNENIGMSTREAYGKALSEIGKTDNDIVVLDADLSKSTKTGTFAKEFPERFFDIGIAEANMTSIAAGLAYCGKIPFISSFACFLMCKSYDQLRMGASYPYNNVKVAVSHSGISIGEDGPSQQSIEDVALALSLPNFVVLVPSDEVSTASLVHLAKAHFGPVYIRTGRPKVPVIYQENEEFEIGKAKRLSDGKDTAIIANGLMVSEAVKAAESLLKENIEVSVIDAYSVKPIDEELIIKVAKETGAVVVVEEHSVYGGLGSVVSKILLQNHPVPFEHIGIKDTYAESGTPYGLISKYGLSYPFIVKAVKKAITNKN